jgi:hypothetical protein
MLRPFHPPFRKTPFTHSPHRRITNHIQNEESADFIYHSSSIAVFDSDVSNVYAGAILPGFGDFVAHDIDIMRFHRDTTESGVRVRRKVCQRE